MFATITSELLGYGLHEGDLVVRATNAVSQVEAPPFLRFKDITLLLRAATVVPVEMRAMRECSPTFSAQAIFPLKEL